MRLVLLRIFLLVHMIKEHEAVCKGFPLESVPMTGKMNWDGFELNLASYTVMPACGDEHVFRKANLYVGVAQVCCEAPKS